MQILLPALLLLAACGAPPMGQATAQDARASPAAGPVAPKFSAPDRPVADIVSAVWADESSRDSAGEVEEVVRLAGIKPGQSVADIGAGSGYYTVRLSPLVGPTGKVYANDIVPDYLERLRRRAKAAGLSNVAFVAGEAGNAKLPPASVDVALMIHMYHEISDPFGLLWHLHGSLKPGGRVAIVDSDRLTYRHGTPPALLACELKAAGFRQIARHGLDGGSYLALFEPVARPEPQSIRPCKAG